MALNFFLISIPCHDFFRCLNVPFFKTLSIFQEAFTAWKMYKVAGKERRVQEPIPLCQFSNSCSYCFLGIPLSFTVLGILVSQMTVVTQRKSKDKEFLVALTADD